MIIRPEEWIEKPDENGDGFLLAWVVSGDQEYPIPIETHHVTIEDVMLNKDQEFDFILECAEKPDTGDVITISQLKEKKSSTLSILHRRQASAQESENRLIKQISRFFCLIVFFH